MIGATLGGAAHDMIILFASVRRGGKTLGQMVREEIGPGVGAVALISVLAIMIILLAVLALVVVQALAKSPWGIFTIAMTIPVALIMGFGLRSGKVNVTAVTIFGLLGLTFGVWGGQFLAHFPAIEAWFRHDAIWVAWAIMIYGLGRFDPAGLDVANTARLFEHVLEIGNGGCARCRRHCDSSDTANAGADAALSTAADLFLPVRFFRLFALRLLAARSQVFIRSLLRARLRKWSEANRVFATSVMAR